LPSTLSATPAQFIGWSSTAAFPIFGSAATFDFKSPQSTIGLRKTLLDYKKLFRKSPSSRSLIGSNFSRSGRADRLRGPLWVTNLNGDTVIELVGTAAPIKTPFIGPPQLP
jgi:hypothetical protein